VADVIKLGKYAHLALHHEPLTPFGFMAGLLIVGQKPANYKRAGWRIKE
jgi:hypothetical protein